MKFLNNIDLARNQLLNPVLQNLASAPASPVEGLIFYDSTLHTPFVYNGTDWISFLAGAFSDLTGTPTTLAGYGIIDARLLADPIAEAEVTGLTAALALKAPLDAPTFTGVPAGPTAAAATNTTQLATTAFVRTEVTALIDASPGTLDTLNELAAALGDDPNFATSISVAIGLKANNDAPTFTTSVTLPGAPTADLHAATKLYVDSAVGVGVVVHKYSTNVGDAAATSFTITHNLNSRDVTVGVREAGTPWAVVQPDIAMTTVNTLTLTFSVAPATNFYRCTVTG